MLSLAWSCSLRPHSLLLLGDTETEEALHIFINKHKYCWKIKSVWSEPEVKEVGKVKGTTGNPTLCPLTHLACRLVWSHRKMFLLFTSQQFASSFILLTRRSVSSSSLCVFLQAEWTLPNIYVSVCPVSIFRCCKRRGTLQCRYCWKAASWNIWVYSAGSPTKHVPTSDFFIPWLWHTDYLCLWNPPKLLHEVCKAVGVNCNCLYVLKCFSRSFINRYD